MLQNTKTCKQYLAQTKLCLFFFKREKEKIKQLSKLHVPCMHFGSKKLATINIFSLQLLINHNPINKITLLNLFSPQQLLIFFFLPQQRYYIADHNQTIKKTTNKQKQNK
jgi:hypothetical protein